MEAVAREAIEEACSLLGASPVETKKYPVILKNSVICEMLSMYLPSFGADTVRKNISKLAGQAGKEVASEIVNLVEDPEGLDARSFDDEGTPTIKKYLIRDGILGRIFVQSGRGASGGKEFYRKWVQIQLSKCSGNWDNKSETDRRRKIKRDVDRRTAGWVIYYCL